jgi:hypothetical protein
MKQKSQWMPLDEAIRHVMRAEGCSREQAFEKLREKLVAGQIKSRAKSFELLPKQYPGGSKQEH